MTHDYTFKTYIANGREYYEYSVDVLTWTERSELERRDQSVLIKKDFPFPESLLSLLYLDLGTVELLTKKIDKAIREFLPSNDDRYVDEVLATLDELAVRSAVGGCRASGSLTSRPTSRRCSGRSLTFLAMR